MTGSVSVAIPILYLASGLFFFLLGLTILRIGRASAPTRAAALMLFFSGIGPLLAAASIVLETNLREGTVVHQGMLESFEYLWEFYFPSLMLFALSFPTENPQVRRYPVLAVAIFFPYFFHLAVMMYGDRLLDLVMGVGNVLPANRDVSVASRELAVGGLDNVITAFVRLLERIHRHAFAVVNMVYSGSALTLLWRGRRALVHPGVARQLRTVSVGLSTSVGVYAVAKITSMTSPPLVASDVQAALISLALVVGGGTIAYAIIRRQFLGIRHVMRLGALYTAIAGLFALLYVIVVRPIGEYFGNYSDVSRQVFEAGFVIVAVIGFQPLLIRAEEVLERVLLRGRTDSSNRFRRLGESISATATVEELEELLKVRLRETIDTSAVHLVQTSATTDGLAALLQEIGESVRRADLDRLRESTDRTKRGRIDRLLRRDARHHELREELQDALAMLEQHPFAAELGGHTADVFVPLLRGKVCVGYLVLGEKIYGVPYADDDLSRLALLSTQLVSSLENIRLLRENLERKLLEEELRIARKIQTQLLPGAPPLLRGFELSAVTVPSRYVGGDYYDFVLIEDRWLALVVADVSGKGIPASILTATLQATVRSNVDVQTDPETMMSRLNRLLYRNTSASEFATLFYAVVDMETGHVRYSNAGHEFPFIACGRRVEQLGESGIVLGCLEEFDYTTNECEIPHGGTLVIYTDGVTDAESSTEEPWGADRLQGLLQGNTDCSAQDLCGKVVDAVRAFSVNESQDDLTLVVLKRSA